MRLSLIGKENCSEEEMSCYIRKKYSENRQHISCCKAAFSIYLCQGEIRKEALAVLPGVGLVSSLQACPILGM